VRGERRVKGCKNLRLNLNAEDAEDAEKKREKEKSVFIRNAFSYNSNTEN